MQPVYARVITITSRLQLLGFTALASGMVALPQPFKGIVQIAVGTEFKAEPASFLNLSGPNASVFLKSSANGSGWSVEPKGQRIGSFHAARTGQQREYYVFAIESRESKETARADLRPVMYFASQSGRPCLHLLGYRGQGRSRLSRGLHGFAAAGVSRCTSKMRFTWLRPSRWSLPPTLMTISMPDTETKSPLNTLPSRSSIVS